MSDAALARALDNCRDSARRAELSSEWDRRGLRGYVIRNGQAVKASTIDWDLDPFEFPAEVAA
jgi:hypothetical protein